MKRLGLRWNHRWIVLIYVFCCVHSSSLGVEKQSKRVIYLGDSQSIGAFGKTFDRSMRSSGLQVYTVVAGGSSPYYWLKAYRSIPSSIGFWEKSPDGERRLRYIRAVPKLESLLAKHEPNVVVVQTGINLYATLRSKRHSKDENRREVISLIDQMCMAVTKSGAKSYWILPPDSHEKKYPKTLQTELCSIISDCVKRYEGEVFESQSCTKYTDPYPATDGIHFGNEQSIEWANKVGSHFSSHMKTGPKKSPSFIPKTVPLQTTSSSNSTSPLPYKSTIPSGSTQKKVGSKSYENNEPVDLVLRLVAKSEIPSPNTAPYDRSLGMFEYKVMKVRGGIYTFDRIRVAHGIMFQKKLTSAARRKIGDTIGLTLVPKKKYPNLESWHMEDQLPPNSALPEYTPKLD